VTCVVDCGQTVNPMTIRAQMQGAIVFGMGATLKSEITVKNGFINQSNYDDYKVLRMHEMPRIDVHIIKNMEDPGGVGEPGLPPIAPAITNAVFAATGKRIRKLPITPNDIAA
jgi:isoquinoline 1-oxidoreductase beta subunit